MFRALGAALPQFGHLPIILGDDGLKLSKRRGAVSVTDYEDNGYLPEGMNNYLARLGWSHGDDELFTLEQMVAWFDGSHLNKSPAQWDPAKLLWVNAHHMKQADDARLATLVAGATEEAGHRRRGRRRDGGALRAAEGSLPDHRRTGRLDRDVLRRGRAGAGRRRPARHRASPRPRCARCARSSRPCAWDKAAHRRRDEGDARRARDQDAAAGDPAARGRVRPRADAGASTRCWRFSNEKLCSTACALFEICSILAVFALHHAMRFRKSNAEANIVGV